MRQILVIVVDLAEERAEDREAEETINPLEDHVIPHRPRDPDQGQIHFHAPTEEVLHKIPDHGSR